MGQTTRATTATARFHAHSPGAPRATAGIALRRPAPGGAAPLGKWLFLPEGLLWLRAGRTCGADAWRHPPAKGPHPGAAAAEALLPGRRGQQLAARSLPSCSGSSLDQERPLAPSPETQVTSKRHRKCHPLRQAAWPSRATRPLPLRPGSWPDHVVAGPLSPAAALGGRGRAFPRRPCPLRAPGTGLQEAGA